MFNYIVQVQTLLKITFICIFWYCADTGQCIWLTTSTASGMKFSTLILQYKHVALIRNRSWKTEEREWHKRTWNQKQISLMSLSLNTQSRLTSFLLTGQTARCWLVHALVRRTSLNMWHCASICPIHSFHWYLLITVYREGFVLGWFIFKTMSTLNVW